MQHLHSARPLLSVVVDTEECFDWRAPFDRRAVDVGAIEALSDAQAIFDDYGIRPAYLLSYPVADQEQGWRPLKEMADGNRCLIGAHLHPWVCPPHVEEVNAFNSYPGNLPADLEREKLSRLTQRIAAVFGQPPRIYKGGRYGAGPHTADILLDLGYRVDTSPCPPFDFSPDGGPDYSRTSNHPLWHGPPGTGLLRLPTTGAYVGFWPFDRHALFTRVERPWGKRLKMLAVLSRLGVIDRIRLSPEGFSLDELIRVTRVLRSQGVTFFSFSFHSPSMVPGNTPYVRDDGQRQRLLDTFRGYFDFFFGHLKGGTLTPLDVYERLGGRGE